MDSNIIAALIGATGAVAAALIAILSNRNRTAGGRNTLIDEPPSSVPTPIRPPVKPFTALPSDGVGPRGTQEVIFPIIEMVIEEAYQKDQKFITAKEIAKLLLLDSKALATIVAAQKTWKNNPPLDRVATNMVSWFTVRFVESGSDQRLDKTEINRQAAYRPKQASGLEERNRS